MSRVVFQTRLDGRRIECCSEVIAIIFCTESGGNAAVESRLSVTS